MEVSKNKTRLHAILQPRDAEVRFLEVIVALAIGEFEFAMMWLGNVQSFKTYVFSF